MTPLHPNSDAETLQQHSAPKHSETKIRFDKNIQTICHIAQ